MAKITPQQEALANGTFTLFDVFDILSISGGIDLPTGTATAQGYDAKVQFGVAGSGTTSTVQYLQVFFDGSLSLLIDGLNINYEKLQAAVEKADGGDGPIKAIANLFMGYDWQVDMSKNHNAVALIGTGGSDDFKSGSGDDSLYLDGGGDSASLGAGNDTIFAWNSFGYAATGVASVINGGAGTDILSLDGGFFQTGQTVNLAGTTTISDRGVNFSFKLKSVENAIGSEFGDNLTGTSGSNMLNGAGGNDRVQGGGGNDDLFGWFGKDRLDGGAGTDKLTGGEDADIFIYRSAKDSLVGKQHDVISDFKHKVDDIDLSSLHPDTKSDKFSFIGSDKFGHHAGELRSEIHDNPGTLKDFTLVQADLDGNGKADIEIELTGVLHLDKGDFVL